MQISITVSQGEITHADKLTVQLDDEQNATVGESRNVGNSQGSSG